MQDALDEAEQSFVYSCFCAGVTAVSVSGLSCPAGVGLEVVLFPSTPKGNPGEMVCTCRIVRACAMVIHRAIELTAQFKTLGFPGCHTGPNGKIIMHDALRVGGSEGDAPVL